MNDTEKILNAFDDFKKYFDVKIDGVISEISELKSDVSGLKADMIEVKSDISELKSDVSGLKAEVSELNTRVSKLEQNDTILLAAAKASTESAFEASQQATDTHNTVALLENTVIPRINGIYDELAIHKDIYNNHELRIKKLENFKRAL